MTDKVDSLTKAMESAKKTVGEVVDKVGDKIKDIAISMSEYSISAPIKNGRARTIKAEEQISGGQSVDATERPVETPSNYSDPKTGKIGFFK